MSLTDMYPAKNNSPSTTTTVSLNSSDTTMTLEDASVLPAAPNIAVLGSDEDAEIVKYTAINGNTVSIIRGQNGTTPGVWPSGTSVARNFTVADHEAFRENILDLDQRKQDNLTFDSTPTEDSSNPVTSDGIYDALGTKLDLTGGSLSGHLKVVRDVLDKENIAAQTPIAADSYADTNISHAYAVKDSNNTRVGSIIFSQKSDNIRKLALSLLRSVNGSEIENAFSLGIDNSGNKLYSVSDALKFANDLRLINQYENNHQYNAANDIPENVGYCVVKTGANFDTDLRNALNGISYSSYAYVIQYTYLTASNVLNRLQIAFPYTGYSPNSTSDCNIFAWRTYYNDVGWTKWHRVSDETPYNITSSYFPNDAGQGQYSYAKIINNVLYMSYQSSAKSTHQKDEILFRINSGYRPPSSCYVYTNAAIWSDSVCSLAAVRFLPNGNVVIQNLASSSANGYIAFSCSYPLS